VVAEEFNARISELFALRDPVVPRIAPRSRGRNRIQAGSNFELISLKRVNGDLSPAWSREERIKEMKRTRLAEQVRNPVARRETREETLRYLRDPEMTSDQQAN